MTISYNWLKNYLNIAISPDEVSLLLTACGLEVESVEKYQSISGGLEGLVIGEVKEREKHPDADRLSVTKVDVGSGELLNIVCGAPNVQAGQKVVVAPVGANLYPSSGDPFEIKKSKIRGVVSEGMLCAEDEIGLGSSHEGIIVLNSEVAVGMSAADYFNVETDYIFEIGLTPNRADAASHYGVARDLAAVLQSNPAYSHSNSSLSLPSVEGFKVLTSSRKINVDVKDSQACLRYSALTIDGVKVGASPAWLKNRLKSIGVKTINNVVDVTNYVLHELGQPLHAFDADKIKGNQVFVQKLPSGSKFLTLDHIERSLSEQDLMICDQEKPLCIAGVFGGENSGISDTTTSIFLESACFSPVSVRKTSKFHGLKTDASFRFERGTDPDITVYALKRAALLIQEIAGGQISSDVMDFYPAPVEPFKIDFSYERCDNLIGKKIDRAIIKNIIKSLGITITSEGNERLHLAVPPFKVDVQREVDVIEEILRIYGYNNVEIPNQLNASLSYHPKPDKEKLQDLISNFLTDKGFNEIMNNSLVKAEYAALSEGLDKTVVRILNPLSSDLGVMRQSLLFGGLESLSFNQNRKNSDNKFYEFGKSYHLVNEAATVVTEKYSEQSHLCLWLSGRKQAENWNSEKQLVDFYDLKSAVIAVLNRLGIANLSYRETTKDIFAYCLEIVANKQVLVELGLVNLKVAKKFDLTQEVYFADLNWNSIVAHTAKSKVSYKEVSKFPVVRRDLSLLIDAQVKFEQLEQMAFQNEKSLLKEVNLFDIYIGDKLPKGKKSYALSFMLQDEEKTLTDKQIDKVMEKLMKNFEDKFGASLRG
jgi:phenylalanyl-tRNA synthetase beta chain